MRRFEVVSKVFGAGILIKLWIKARREHAQECVV
mgnify:CR=1 FL=1